MNTPLDELFSLYCMQNLQMPPNFHEFPHYPALARCLSHKQRRALLRLFDECTLAHAIYAQDCFSGAPVPPCQLIASARAART